jgi:predicted patatin/cPLA2 family phospholipase
VDYLEDKNYCGLYSLWKTGDFFGKEMAYHTIPEEYYPLENQVFQESGAEFYAVVTDCRTGRPVYHQVKDMYGDMEYIRASASLPLLSRMVEIQGGLYLDGGIADSIPLLASEKMGSAKNVVVLTQPRSYRKKPNRMYPVMRLKYRRYPRLLEAVKTRHLVYNKTLEDLAQREREGKALVIAPAEDLGLGRLEKDKEKLKAAYDRGYRDGENALPALLKFLNS